MTKLSTEIRLLILGRRFLCIQLLNFL